MTQHKTVRKRILHHSPTTRLCELVACLATLPPWQSSPRKARNAWNAWNPSQWYKNEYGKSCQHIQLQEEGNSWRSPTSCSPNCPHVFFKHCLAAAQQHAKAQDTQNSHGFFRLQKWRDDRVGFRFQVSLIGLSPRLQNSNQQNAPTLSPSWQCKEGSQNAGSSGLSGSPKLLVSKPQPNQNSSKNAVLQPLQLSGDPASIKPSSSIAVICGCAVSCKNVGSQCVFKIILWCPYRYI